MVSHKFQKLSNRALERWSIPVVRAARHQVPLPVLQRPRTRHETEKAMGGSRKKLNWHADKEIMEALKIGRTQDMTQEGIQGSTLFIANKHIRSVYRKQFQLGWNQIYLGWFHNEWTKIPYPDQQGESIRNLPAMISILWSYGLQLWQQRNLLHHGKNGENSSNTAIKIDRLIIEIKEVLRNEVDYNRRRILQPDCSSNKNWSHSNTVT